MYFTLDNKPVDGSEVLFRPDEKGYRKGIVKSYYCREDFWIQDPETKINHLIHISNIKLITKC
jgi:hypothetical protein